MRADDVELEYNVIVVANEAVRSLENPWISICRRKCAALPCWQPEAAPPLPQMYDQQRLRLHPCHRPVWLADTEPGHEKPALLKIMLAEGAWPQEPSTAGACHCLPLPAAVVRPPGRSVCVANPAQDTRTCACHQLASSLPSIAASPQILQRSQSSAPAGLESTPSPSVGPPLPPHALPLQLLQACWG